MMRNKVMMVVFFLCAQSLFSQITVTEGATLYVDGKNIVTTPKDAEKDVTPETILTAEVKALNKNRFDSDKNFSQKKVKKSDLKAFAKISPKKKRLRKR